MSNKKFIHMGTINLESGRIVLFDPARLSALCPECEGEHDGVSVFTGVVPSAHAMHTFSGIYGHPADAFDPAIAVAESAYFECIVDIGARYDGDGAVKELRLRFREQ
ncbi:hypothetical protein [Algiphilus aromaticivorans]|uniref:hypothetical protein n=1 Tax=Algiphilus aromaticivorans TaxID=382454 RepID=UPI0005C17F5F|nr:hypothetical protein [Algiphilus aromaticivorans]